MKSICKHCGRPIENIAGWMHLPASDESPYYTFCLCKCVGCTSDSNDWSHCHDGEEATPTEVLA